MTEEIIQKRKEEELALRFAEPGSKELYFADRAVKNDGNMTRVIHEEKWDIAFAGPILPSTINLFSIQPSIRTELRVEHSPKRDDDDNEDDHNDRLERQSEEELREQRDKRADGSSSSLAPPLDVSLLPSVGPVIPSSTSDEPAPLSEIDPISQPLAPSNIVDGDTTQTDT
ncbi:hypothetical protein K7X08_016008 [Anisodus acutangulus]|uniref:Uncharacterized protein n=1 Tax=Anisodus acutangulus TaxID=402998 RepID=A0A9Q1LBA5_9SOLA|nr:hypothetical protein K7X08_016008 [Anisodus acutangulus]